MIEQQATVIHLIPGGVRVRAEATSACGSCQSGKGCGISFFSRLFTRRHPDLEIKSDLPLRQGDRVLLGIDESTFVIGSVLIYFLPLVLLLVGALFGQWLASQFLTSRQEWLPIVFGALGFALAFLILRWRLGKTQIRAVQQVRILNKLDSNY